MIANDALFAQGSRIGSQSSEGWPAVLTVGLRCLVASSFARPVAG